MGLSARMLLERYFSVEDIKDALRAFLYSKKNLRIAAAVDLYKNGEITWARLLKSLTWE